MEGAGREGETPCLPASSARAKTRVTHVTKSKPIDVEEKGEEAEEERKEGEAEQNE